MAFWTTALVVISTFPLAYVVYNALTFYLDLKRRARHINKCPGPDPHILWGHLHEFPGPQEAGLRYMHERSKDNADGIGRSFYGQIPAIGVFLPATIKAVLKTSEPKPRVFGGYKFILPWIGDGLLIAGGQKWARNRRLITPGFHFDILKPYIGINNQCAELMLDKLSNLAAKGSSFEMMGHVTLMTLDIILRCAFSYETDCQAEGKTHPYAEAVHFLGESVVDRTLKPWLYPDWIYMNFSARGRKFVKACNYVHSVSDDIIHKRRLALAAHGDSILRGSKYIDFLDILLKATDTDGKHMTDREIRDEVDTFLFEGHDTTASGISWALYSMASHPEYQTQCQEEIDALLEGRDSDEILWDDLNKLPFLTACLKESLRLHTPVCIISRQTTKDSDIGGYFIPANTHVDVHLYVLHHNPLVWDEPYEYRPSRFSPENAEKMDPFAFVPFSAGPRNCVGQNFAMHEMKVVIARILRKFTLEVDPTRETKHELGIVMKTENGMYLKVKPRS